MRKKERIEFKNLNRADLSKFKNFIKRHWHGKHIFTKNTSFFNWQHRKKNIYNCIVAKKDKKIIGVQAFITQNHYDKKLPKDQIFLALFRCLENSIPGLGLKIYKTIIRKYKPNFIGTTGFDPRMIPFHKWQGYKIGKMKHNVAVSSFKKKFVIAKLPSKFNYYITKKNNFSNYKKLKLSDIDKCVANNLYTYQTPYEAPNL